MKMSLDISPETVQTVIDASNSVLLASKETDFGGAVGPIVSLSLIGAIILVLSPPLKDD
eukprot:CAMPEP_0117825714 /NCGR_PEP_ID=MMETSP0949-20121206/5648_1 /TAXON_ID=44440 /ORGANISM="Chattonella subsalsa, Strain CCMP2191" /LENGTH=58 /DNA_ID=CAMNT_0005665753 /DNA_START=215 /DNA_END=391 /DNA_ORIENTATION=-